MNSLRHLPIMSQKLCLKWSDFEANMSIVSDHNYQEHASVQEVHLLDFFDFVYNGEIQMYKGQLPQFVDMAKRFQLEGSMQREDKHVRETEESEDEDNASVVNENTSDHGNKILKGLPEHNYIFQSENYENIEELDLEIEKRMEKQADGKWMCLTCGRIYQRKGHLKEHVETHIDGLEFPCQNCDKVLRTRNNLRSHRNKDRCQKTRRHSMRSTASALRESIEMDEQI